MKCTMPKCKAAISGMTGLQELKNLIKHFACKHKTHLDMETALEVRLELENGQQPFKGLVEHEIRKDLR